MRRRLHFVHSPQVYYEQTFGARFVPVWAYTLAAYVPPSWDLAIYDCTLVDKAEIPIADVFAFSGINQDLEAIRTTQAYLRAKYPRATFILGGPIVWSFEQAGRLEELLYFDHVFVLDGERSLPAFLTTYEESGGASRGEQVIRSERFPLSEVKKIRFDVMGTNAKLYYGGVVEVSRGCPFLCEFCDIRVLPNNNETHPKDIGLIVDELDGYYRLGVSRIQLACDNYLGDPEWAEACTDAILAWVQRTGAKVALYTWITVNICRYPDLMVKMRKAGFTSLFIGVESFNENSVLETAKVQNKNAKNEMVSALLQIQSYGFFVSPGLIFGFDSDPPTMFEDTLAAVAEAGLISGDPTFLLALPGTPLFSRMKRTNRLLGEEATEGVVPLHKTRVSKVQSNIRFLQPRDFLVKGFMKFTRRFTGADYMYSRFARHVKTLVESENLHSTPSPGYGSIPEYLRFQLSDRERLALLQKRLSFFLQRDRARVVLKAFLLVLRHRRRHPALSNHFSTWIFFWTNLLLKYESLTEADFSIHSVDSSYDMGRLWSEVDREEPGLTNGRDSENVKVGAQGRSTKRALKRLKSILGSEYELADFVPPPERS